jgi:hypothetical protein
VLEEFFQGVKQLIKIGLFVYSFVYGELQGTKEFEMIWCMTCLL